MGTVTETMMRELEVNVEAPEFTVDNISELNCAAVGLSQWTLAVYTEAKKARSA